MNKLTKVRRKTYLKFDHYIFRFLPVLLGLRLFKLETNRIFDSINYSANNIFLLIEFRNENLVELFPHKVS